MGLDMQLHDGLKFGHGQESNDLEIIEDGPTGL